jgi:hypothetical protein
MSLDECKITVPGRHVAYGLPNEAKNPNSGNQGNTTRPWHTLTRPVSKFIAGMGGYAKPVSDHLKGCDSCCLDYISRWQDPGKRSRLMFSNFDRKGSIPKVLYKKGVLPNDVAVSMFSREGWDGFQWLAKNEAPDEILVQLAISGITTGALSLKAKSLVRTPAFSNGGDGPNYGYLDMEKWEKIDLIRNEDAAIPVKEGVKFSRPFPKALEIARSVWALQKLKLDIPAKVDDLVARGKEALALIYVNKV